MAQLIVRNIDEKVKAGLKRRAHRNGRSMEAEVRDILRAASKENAPPKVGLGSEIAAMVKGTGLKFEIQELRGHTIKPLSFDE